MPLTVLELDLAAAAACRIARVRSNGYCGKLTRLAPPAGELTNGIRARLDANQQVIPTAHLRTARRAAPRATGRPTTTPRRTPTPRRPAT